LLLLSILLACSSGEIKPVPVEDGDMCSFCKMAISEKQFAAEIITDDERVLKFDDVGCLLRYRQKAAGELKPAAIFVSDYDSREWIMAENAFFVKSKTVKSPMGSGIIAYGDRSKAGQDSQKFGELTP
jgi:copper chaperone NosL